jgi:hypothetical protein
MEIKILDCGCDNKPDEEKIKRTLREIEKANKKRTVRIRPIKKGDPAVLIPAPDIFTRKVKKEESVPA